MSFFLIRFLSLAMEAWFGVPGIVTEQEMQLLREHLLAHFGEIELEHSTAMVFFTLARRRDVDGTTMTKTLTSRSISAVGAVFVDFPLLPESLCPHTSKGYASPHAKQLWAAPLEKLLASEFHEALQRLLPRCVTAGDWSAARFAALGHTCVPSVPYPCRWFQDAAAVHGKLCNAAGPLACLLPDASVFAQALRAALRACQKERWARKTPGERAAFRACQKERWARMTPEEREAISKERAERMEDLWRKRSQVDRESISTAMKLRWTTARRLTASLKRKAALDEKGTHELAAYMRAMRAAHTLKQRLEFTRKIGELYHLVVVDKRHRGETCSAAAFKILQGSFRIFKADLDEQTRTQAAALFKASSIQSKTASRVTCSIRVRENLRKDVAAIHQRWRQHGMPLRDEELQIVRRLETAYGSLKDAPPDLASMVNEVRGGSGHALSSRRMSSTKCQSFLQTLIEYETRLAVRGPQVGMLSTVEARRLAARSTTFRDEMSEVERDRYDRVYLAYLWRNGKQARRKGTDALACRRTDRKRPVTCLTTLAETSDNLVA